MPIPANFAGLINMFDCGWLSVVVCVETDKGRMGEIGPTRQVVTRHNFASFQRNHAS